MGLKNKYIVKAYLPLLIMASMAISSHQTFAQPNIANAEYFFDNDPGFGNGIAISIPVATTFDINILVTQGLAPGSHTISVRTKDALGVWGFSERRQIYIPPGTTSDPPIADIQTMEYYIDSDPGFGNGTPITISVTDLVDIPLEIIEASAQTVGYHTLAIRSQNTDGVWGFSEKRQFYIPTGTTSDPPVADLAEMEYFFDTDPGFGNGIDIPISSGSIIDINELIPESLSSGYHTISIRAKNTNGVWGMSESRPVYIKPVVSSESLSDIVKIEYYFDGADPGIGNGIDLPITPGPLVDLNTVDVPTSPALIDGPHTITFRAQNADGIWGMGEESTFDVLDDCTQPIAAFTPQLACVGQTVTFLDTSSDIQADATYRWYLNGDAIIDDTNVGNSSFTYALPGTYVVALAIRQGTICLDSIATTIDIQALPVAVFSTSGTTVNQPTNFTASANSLPPGSTWEWDFDGDLSIDDNTAGNTSFTYTTEATFNPTLTITDGLGCSITITNPITISSSGGGGAPPSIDFLAGNSCIGNTINFIDLSQNLPPGSTYSWDFDGDGNEDSAIFGTVSYAYPSAGTYTARLIIDLGGSTIEATHTVEIVANPLADFSAEDICEGTAMSFDDLSTGTELTAVYMWDFDNDGLIDSNAKTAVSFTFPASGSYVVSLIVSNGFGCTSEVVKQVTVVGLPIPDFEWDIVCSGETISFNDLSTNVDNSAIYHWDLDGDGAEDLNTMGDVSFTYSTAGIYDASLTIDNPAGCSVTITKSIEIFDRPEVIIEVVARCYGQSSQMMDMSQNVSTTASYFWDFENDGQVDDTAVGSTNFTYASFNSYVVSLEIDNGGGCASSAEKLVVFSDAASPDFIVNKTCQGEAVVFTDLSSSLETGAIYSWDFDGDNLEDSAFPGSTAYTFNTAGIYPATLTIDNGGQCLAYKTVQLEITEPPVVDLGPNLQLCSAGVVNFDAGSGYSSYLWPDGSMLQTYTTDTIGSYMVRVQDAKGCFNTDTISVELLGAPIPSFDHSIELSLDGIIVSFTNTTLNANTYAWTLGDGTTSDEIDVSHIYSDFSFYETSVYEVCLTAINDCEQAQFCEAIFVSPTQFLEEGGDQFSVYPNPASDIIYIELAEVTNDLMQINLLDSQGKSIWLSSNPESKFELSISHLPQGVYYLIIQQSDKFLYKRIIKN